MCAECKPLICIAVTNTRAAICQKKNWTKFEVVVVHGMDHPKSEKEKNNWTAMVCNIKGWNKNDEFWRFQSSDIKSWKENEHDVWSLTSEESGGVRVWGNRNNHNQLSFLCRERVFGEREKKGKTQRKKWKDGRVKCRSQEKMTEWETRRERKVSAWCFYWICQHGSRGLGYFYMWGIFLS